ncbi:hypothetical protein ACFWBN_14395 [Streptomyces sp. NPDC059989]|uniref:hypothetical protein n=1 Tax=Streptomyces sp. NPDC059989 TaxID=3347026 RepID=UPI0036899552
MIIALFVFLIVGVMVVVTPGAVLGYVLVVVSGRLPLGARVPLMLVLAAGSASLWLALGGVAAFWQPSIVVLSFSATLISGFTFLARETRRRRAPHTPPVVWPGWHPPVNPS